MNSKTLIATYTTPDLDGFACGFALEEFLRNGDQNVQMGLWGGLSSEVSFLVDYLKVAVPPQGRSLMDDNCVFILVDASDKNGIDQSIAPTKVISVIDHRKFYDPDAFPNAVYEISFVGAAATIVAEKFMIKSLAITTNAATLLYYAIISNTINFKASVTTDRDRAAAAWLAENGRVNMGLTKTMFTRKTEDIIVGESFFKQYYISYPVIQTHRFAIIQLEIIDGLRFISKNEQQLIDIIAKIKNEENLNYVFYTIIDLELGFNYLLAPDIPTQQLLTKALPLSVFNENDFATTDKIFMRKEIVPRLNETLHGS